MVKTSAKWKKKKKKKKMLDSSYYGAKDERNNSGFIMVPLNPNMHCLCKQRRSRTVGSKEANWSGSALFVIICICIYNLDQVIWLKIGSGWCGILIYSWHGLTFDYNIKKFYYSQIFSFIHFRIGQWYM